MCTDGDWRQEFVRLLSSPQAVDWTQARAIKLANMPPTLFRYCAPPNPEARADYSLDNLRRKTIWLSSAATFNDLLDTTVGDVGAIETTNAMLQRDLSSGKLAVPAIVRSSLPGAKDALGAFDDAFSAEIASRLGPEAAARAKDFFRNFIIKESKEMSAKASEFFQRATKVACFSETGTSPLLWAHYAGKHTGFCVEYPFTEFEPNDFRVHWLVPVIYTSQRFSLASILLSFVKTGQMNPFVPYLAALHKSPHWAYEKEWRIVAPIGDDSPGLEWTMPTPSRLFLGSRMDAAYRTKVIEIAREQGIKIFEMTTSQDRFDLVPVALT
jgi:hypothetical protein